MRKLFKLIYRVAAVSFVLMLALTIYFLLNPNAFHEAVSTLLLDVELLDPPQTSEAARISALEKIAMLHTLYRSQPKQRKTVSLSGIEMNSYILHRLEEQNRAGQLPKPVREAIENVQIRFTDGGFTIKGNVDMAGIAGYIEGQVDVEIPEAYRKRKTTFKVTGTLETHDGRGSVAITGKRFGRLSDALGDPLPKAEEIARQLVGSTLVKDFLTAQVVSDSELKFQLPTGMESVTLREDYIDVTLAPANTTR